jgi:hypothetical protein
MSNLAANINKALGTANKPKVPNVGLAPAPSPSAPMNSSLFPAPSVNTLTRNIQNMTKNVSNNVNYFSSKISNGITNAGNSVTNTFANAGKNVSDTVTNAGKMMNERLSDVGEVAVNTAMNTGNAIKNTITNTGAAVLPEDVGAGWAFPAGIFVACTIVFVVIFVFFKNEIKDGADNLIQSIRSVLGLEVPPPRFEDAIPAPPPSTTGPMPPQLNLPPSSTQTIVEKILPLGSPEVFNVSKNDYTYYDAEPLCKALGAQLATYDQVKDSYEKGADWCNYGWVKGQVAVYPTQKNTWDSIQQGPEEERGACGKPGLNGGYFDNPELRFGVNCYGVKPNQSAHDEAELMKKGVIPKTTAGLKIEKKIQEFQEESTQLGILPFNEGKWSSA